MRPLVAVVLLLVSTVVPIISFPTGAPFEACSTVTPNHPATAQNSTNPYSIDLSVFDDGNGGFRYMPGRTHQLTLSAAGNSPTFRGFFIQGRLAADDSPGVGTFVTPSPRSDVARLSSCNTPSSAITHYCGGDKDSVTVSWTAPSTGTGAVTFAYAVVQTYLTFWANERTSTIQEGSCTLPFYESSDLCVETCPTNQFGNHTSGQCQQYPADYNVSLNATTYVAEITADTPFGTPVLYLGAVIDGSAFTSPFILLSTVASNLVERVFKFPNGHSDEQYIGLIPDPATNTITIVNQIVYFDDPRNAPPGQSPPTLPITLETTINLVAVDVGGGGGTPDPVDRSVSAFVTVTPPPDPCQSNPCMRGGTCNAQSTMSYTCSCLPDFTGNNCQTQIDDCEGVNCGNGTCMDLIESFECICTPGFTDTFCNTNINECETIGCVNGICIDLINGIECDCYPDWTGARCEIDIDHCEPRPFGQCDSTGSVGCNDGNTTYTCSCVIGFTGYNCSQDIDECESIPASTSEPACFNDGNCTNLLFGRFECGCPSEYSGDRCEIDITPCDPNPCENSGTCIQSGISDFTCNCPPGYTGLICSMEINECTSDPCDNGGTCTDMVNGFICQCPMGYSGAMCEVDENFCTTDTCQNAGTCVEGNSTETTCVCADGFSGPNCTTDLSFCTPTTCMNGGTCIEGRGTMIMCECSTGFTGMMCETDPPDCEPTTCDNGGMCMEEYGPTTSCICVDGFNGTTCEFDLPFCEVDTCLNGGTCNEGPGTITTCDCAAGFTYTDCSVDLDFCTPTTCRNGGTCFERVGEQTRCECTAGFAGILCDEDDLGHVACTPTTCMNAGTCVEEFGPDTSCSCPEGYSGANCERDLPFCTFEACLNGGTCNEGPGIITTCDCVAGFTGANCSVDLEFCTASTCLNGGTCSEGPGIETTCYCNVGFSGSDCSVDLDFCMPDTCGNGGTCTEGLGNGTSCSCSEGFTGFACEIDLPFCQAETCFNGGTCFEGPGTATRCKCVSGFSGVLCESDLSFCQPDTCLNGGTCLEEVGTRTQCECPPDFTGSDCNTLSEPCEVSLYYYNGDCTAVCPDGYYGNHTTILCTPFPEDYRAILNATRYVATVSSADTHGGESIVSFTVFINNTYFQIPQAIIFRIDTDTNASFVFEDGEESDVLIIDASDPNFDPATVPNLKVLKPILYVGTQPVQVGEYEAELTVTVVPQQEAGTIQLLKSTVQITITGGGATDVTPAEDRVKWIAVGAVVLAVLVAILTTVCVCEIVCGKRQRKYVFDRERNNRHTRTNGTVDPGAEANSIPLNEADINSTTSSTQNAANSGHVDSANPTTTFANTDFSTVIENPSPEHPADGEEATLTTTCGVRSPENIHHSPREPDTTISATPEFSIVIENPSPETSTDGEEAPQTTTHEVPTPENEHPPPKEPNTTT